MASIGNYKAFWAGVVTITDTIFYYIYIYIQCEFGAICGECEDSGEM